MRDMEAGYVDVSNNSVLAGLMQSIINDPSVTANLDFTAISGAFDGMVETLDFGNAILNGADVNSFGANIVQGLADGVSSNVGLIEPPFATVRDSALSSLQAAFQMHSPSQLMAAQGVFIPEGLALGIIGGSGAVVAAMSVMGGMAIGSMATISSQAVATAQGIMSYGQGHSIGTQIVAGMASGIRGGSGAVIAAARQVAQAAARLAPAGPRWRGPNHTTANKEVFQT